MTATAVEVAGPMPGDDLVPEADVVMDRAFTLGASPEQVWPWIVQLGKQRAGWYFPRPWERLIPPSRRAVRHVDPRWQCLAVGDVIPDYGGPHETFEVAAITPPHTLVYVSQRRAMHVSWSITLAPGRPREDARATTRVRLRLRLGPVRRKRLVATAGEFFDWVTIAGMAAGLADRLEESAAPPRDDQSGL